MANKSLLQIDVLPVDDERHAAVVRSSFENLIRIDDTTERNVCRVLKTYLLSRFSVQYFDKLNLVAGLTGISDSQSRGAILSQWIDHDFMDMFNELCDSDIVDNPRSVSAVSDVLAALRESLASVNDEDIAEDMDYLFDIPYRLKELAKESTRPPKSFSHSFRQEGLGWTARGRVARSPGHLAISYTQDVRK